MTAHNWQHLLPKREVIKKMSAVELKDADQSSSEYISVLAHGISGIGNLLACTASNSETGLSERAVADIGWLLESLGALISNLSDVGAEADFHLNEVKLGA